MAMELNLPALPMLSTTVSTHEPDAFVIYFKTPLIPTSS